MSSTLSVLGAPKDQDEPSPPWWTNHYASEGSHVWSASKYKDFQIIIGDEVLCVHKCVLSARSPVFAAMLTSGLTETRTGQLVIQDFDYETVEKAIKFCYSDCFGLGTCATRLWNILLFGHLYDIQHLVRACLHQLKVSGNSYDNSERKFIVKSAFDLGYDQILDPILHIFGVMNGELVPDTCPYPPLGSALAKEEYFKDLKIICDEDGSEFSVHKYILALRSPVFAQIFEFMAENGDTSGRLIINEIEPAAVQKSIKFLYIGYVADEAFENAPPHLILGLLEFADRFQVVQLLSFCLKKIDQSKFNLAKKVISTYIQFAGNFESKKILHFILRIFHTNSFGNFNLKKASHESYWN